MSAFVAASAPPATSSSIFPVPDTTRTKTIRMGPYGDTYNVIGEGSYGKIIYPQLKKYDDLDHYKITLDLKIEAILDVDTYDVIELKIDNTVSAPPVSDEERDRRVTKHLYSVNTASKEINEIKFAFPHIDTLNEHAKKYFFHIDDYTFYISNKTGIPLHEQAMFINMPYGGVNLKSLIGSDILIDQDILEKLSKHHVFLMEEVFEKLKSANFYHNDVKPENIVLYKNEHDDFSIKIIDFGISYNRPSPATFEDVPDILNQILGFYFNFPPTTLLYSYINIVTDDPNDAIKINMNDTPDNILYKIIHKVRSHTDVNFSDHLDYFQNLSSIQEVLNEIPDIIIFNNDAKTKKKPKITFPLFYKLIMNYLRPIVFDESQNMRTIDDMKPLLMQNYFEMLDIWGLFTTYVFLLDKLLIFAKFGIGNTTVPTFDGFDIPLLKQKIILFLKDILFTNHIYHGGISHYKEMIKAHIMNLHTIPASSSSMSVTGGGNADHPELSALDKLPAGWNPTIDKLALKHYEESLSARLTKSKQDFMEKQVDGVSQSAARSAAADYAAAGGKTKKSRRYKRKTRKNKKRNSK